MPYMNNSSNSTKNESADLSSKVPALIVRPMQVFVSSLANIEEVLTRLGGFKTPIQLIPVSPSADVVAKDLCAALQTIGKKVSVTRPLPEGADLSSASSILKV
jgi:hypothetical protein